MLSHSGRHSDCRVCTFPFKALQNLLQLKTTVKADMDSKEGIEKVAPVDAWAAGLLDPSLLRLETDDATTADPPRERAGSPVGSLTSPDENPRRESYCLYVRVLRYSDAILEQDHKVLEYC